MFEGMYEAIGMNGAYQVWYTTLKRCLKKGKSFDTIEEVAKWCKINKSKIKITSGSWQVLEIMDAARGIEKVINDESNSVWKFGKNYVAENKAQ